MNSSLRFLAFALGTGLALAAPTAAHAQVSVGVQIGAPAWGPPVAQGTQYYYIPEIDGYYDIYNQVYIVFDGQQWVQQPYLDGYDPYYFHPYPVSYVGAQPWLYISTYRNRYPQYVTGWHRGGWGSNGPYYGHEYGAGRVYGYGGRPGYYNGNGGFGRPGYNAPPSSRGGQPANNGFGNRGNAGRPDFNPGNGGGFGNRPSAPGGFQGGGLGGNPSQPQRGGFQGGQPGGGQPGGGRGGFQGGGQPGGFGGNRGGGGQPGGGGGRRGGR